MIEPFDEKKHRLRVIYNLLDETIRAYGTKILNSEDVADILEKLIWNNTTLKVMNPDRYEKTYSPKYLYSEAELKEFRIMEELDEKEESKNDG